MRLVAIEQPTGLPRAVLKCAFVYGVESGEAMVVFWRNRNREAGSDDVVLIAVYLCNQYAVCRNVLLILCGPWIDEFNLEGVVTQRDRLR